MGPRRRIALSLVMLIARAAPGNASAAAEEQPALEEPAKIQASSMGLPSVLGLDWKFHLDVSWGMFGFHNALYTNSKPDDPSGNLGDHWFEGAAKPGLSATHTFSGSWQIFGKISAAGERTFGAPPTLVGEAASSFEVDDLYLGLRSGKLLGGLDENALEFTVGRVPYQIGHGYLVWDGTVEGGTRGGYWSNIRRAFAFASIGRFKTGPHTLEAFYLVRDELPEATTGSRVAGFNYEVALGEATTLGATYLRGFAHADKKPTRDGLNVYNLRAFTAPLSSLPGLSFEVEFAYEHNRDLLSSTSWTFQGGYEFDVAWKPRLSYRYAFFQGDDPATSRSEAFDPLFLGFYDWGTWWQGEIAGEYLVSNSNLISHQVRLHVAPAESFSMGLIFYRFHLDQPASLKPEVTSSNLLSELDWYADWKPNQHFTFSFIAAWAKPGEAVAQAYGATADFLYSMIFAAYSY